MLERVGTVTIWGGGGASLPHAANWLDSTRSGLRRKQLVLNYFFMPNVFIQALK